MFQMPGVSADLSASALVLSRNVVPSIEAALAISESADYTDFFRREFPFVLRTIELMLRDHGRAEEITQDAFIQALRPWTKISGYERPDAWVRRVAVRLALRSLRREGLWQAVRSRLLPSAPDRPSPYDVAGAIRRLPGSQ